ncbi:MAG TPA: O-antigen ligase family protein [Dictyobacter sp.]|jgi:O-antigen ligase|nr:O-antigen ligase family protein [Dictyobacter sp.]
MLRRSLLNSSREFVDTFCFTSLPGLLLVFAPIGLLLSILLCLMGYYGFALVIGGLLITIVLVLRLDAIAMICVVATHLYVDWYLGLHLVAPVLAIALLIFYYLLRTPSHPWTRPGISWLWGIFLIITIPPAIRGGRFMLYDAASFYPSDILGAFLMFWLGGVVAHNKWHLRLLFLALTVFAVVLAVHTIIQATTGTILFGSSHIDDFLARSDIDNYQLAGTYTYRSGSFFIDPNWNGAFFALAFFLPLGLFSATTILWEKCCYVGSMVVILIALMFTYSTGSWIAFLIGMFVFLIMVGKTSYRLFLPICIALVVLLVLCFFPAQVQLQLKHATANNELSLRIAVWLTAIRVVQAYPLTGVGLGHQAYLINSNAYRVVEQFVLLSHPHDSYLEWAAMAGIPVLLSFLLVLSGGLWLAWKNWLTGDRELRPLIGAGITATLVLSVNSISINGWTHFALAMIAWLIVGAVASPLVCCDMQG